MPELSEGISAFAFDVYRKLGQDNSENIVFSPYSIWQALAMICAGARGRTAQQIADALFFKLEKPALHYHLVRDLYADLVKRGNIKGISANDSWTTTLRIANALWVEQTFPFNSEYDTLIKQYYGGSLQRTDFANAPEDARQQINDWVAAQTAGRIQNIVPEGEISPITRLMLANTIYFYGSWRRCFDSFNTRDHDFHLLDGTTTSAPFMCQGFDLPYTQDEGFQIVEFPYEGSNFTFTVIMPDEGQFEAIASELDANKLNKAIYKLRSTEVLVYLPKFKFGVGTSLAATLRSLGVVDAFDEATADFTKMIEGTLPQPLSISDVRHKVFICVDENGTEAAATTLSWASYGIPVKRIEVRIDRPFIFAIRDPRTGTLLFLGRVMNPRV